MTVIDTTGEFAEGRVISRKITAVERLGFSRTRAFCDMAVIFGAWVGSWALVILAVSSLTALL
jgi:hypothetical protein